MITKIKETATFIEKYFGEKPEVGIILGTGLGGLVNEIKIIKDLDYHKIPNFPVSTVEGHKGRLIFGELGSKKVVAMQGRFHYYEGYSMQEVTFPVRVMKLLGIKYMFLSNASGGLNPEYRVGDLMIIKDHLNLFPTNPLIVKNLAELGPRFPDMSEAYNKKLIAKAKEIAAANKFDIKEGVYVGSSGPTYETQAEYRYFRTIGADATGMSTVPEVIVASHMGIPCFAISIITNVGIQEKAVITSTHEDVQEQAAKAEPKMTIIMTNLIASL
jgi:purine-nucleoside phosphorylase